MEIIEGKGVGSPEKRDINREREIVRVKRCELPKIGWTQQPKEKNEKGGEGLQEVKGRQAKPPLTWA